VSRNDSNERYHKRLKILWQLRATPRRQNLDPHLHSVRMLFRLRSSIRLRYRGSSYTPQKGRTRNRADMRQSRTLRRKAARYAFLPVCADPARLSSLVRKPEPSGRPKNITVCARGKDPPVSESHEQCRLATGALHHGSRTG
jgi:hypothetical protein